MTVYELIRELSSYPPDKEVEIMAKFDYEFYIGEDNVKINEEEEIVSVEFHDALQINSIESDFPFGREHVCIKAVY